MMSRRMTQKMRHALAGQGVRPRFPTGSVQGASCGMQTNSRSSTITFLREAHHSDPPRTRTWNLRLRGPTPYPLGQRASYEMPSQALPPTGGPTSRATQEGPQMSAKATRMPRGMASRRGRSRTKSYSFRPPGQRISAALVCQRKHV